MKSQKASFQFLIDRLRTQHSGFSARNILLFPGTHRRGGFHDEAIRADLSFGREESKERFLVSSFASAQDKTRNDTEGEGVFIVGVNLVFTR
ncbi:MAG TPA: hypothetical protein VLB01_06530 [Thermodesulfobacteriota bacterium]|nr:hypothetical protein [Thermodesulfobacteriota bacterium]